MLHNLLEIFVRAQIQMSDGLRREEGQGLTEYALILVFVSVVAIVFLTSLGNKITSVISRVANSF